MNTFTDCVPDKLLQINIFMIQWLVVAMVTSGTVSTQYYLIHITTCSCI